MPIPQLTIKHKDDPPPPAPTQLTKQEQRKINWKKNRWGIVGGIALLLAVIGIGYTVFFVVRLIKGSDEEIRSVSDVRDIVVQEFENSEQKDSNWISKALPDSRLLAFTPLMSGSQRFLVLLQNSTELRATGGFIGNLATIQLRDGVLGHYQSFDSYAVDARNNDPASASYPVAPAPIKQYLNQNRLYLRDSNWFPDFRDSAQLILALYPIGSSDREPFSGVIAVNPSVVAEALGLLGPIVVDGVEFTKDNLVEALEYEVEINAPIYKGKSASERKEIVNSLFREMITRIISLPTKQQLQYVKIAEQKLNEKEIQLYFTDNQLQDAAERLQFAGSFGSCPSDCLAIIDSNLRALKTDSAIQRSVAYSVVEYNGSVKGRLNLTYTNSGYYDWKTTDYRSYTRVYMPKGSSISSAKRLNNELGIYEPISIEEQGEYRGRSYVGFFHVTKVKSTGEIVLEYELPPNVEYSIQQRAYSLNVTKQAGTYPPFTFKADFEAPVTSATGGNVQIDNGNAAITTRLISDVTFTIP